MICQENGIAVYLSDGIEIIVAEETEEECQCICNSRINSETKAQLIIRQIISELNLYNIREVHMELDSSIIVKLATTADANLVSKIVALSYKDCQEKFKPTPNKIPTWLEWWKSLSKPQLYDHQKFIEGGLTYLILLNSTVIGTFRLEQHDYKSELDDFCILPQYQNQGYGMYTLTLIDTLCSANCIELATPYFCSANRYLYEKAGYKQIGTRSDDTVICFEKSL